MRSLFIYFPASDYSRSKEFYENAIGLPIEREYNGAPHKFTNYKIGEVSLKLFEWKDKWYGSGHNACHNG